MPNKQTTRGREGCFVIALIFCCVSLAPAAGLFDPLKAAPTVAQQVAEDEDSRRLDEKPDSLDALFGTDETSEQPKRKAYGFWQLETAYTVAAPRHLSKLRNRLELARQGSFTPGLQWKISAGAYYDAVYDLTDFYPTAVRRDQRVDLLLRENYLDVGSGNWDFRFGRQHIIWGEMVALFMADVVSAKDLREFVLPEFELLRLPQWAARAEYSRSDFHAEAIWIPVMTYDEIGKPGSDFYPFPPAPPPGFAFIVNDEQRPGRKLSNSAYGLRLSYLTAGWDLSGFYYRSVDASPTFFRQVVTDPTPAFIYQPDHDKIHQWGTTLAKDLGFSVLKAEAVYTRDRNFNVTRLNDANGVVRQDFLDYIIGLDFTLPKETRLNLQFLQRWFQDHDADIVPERIESAATIYASSKLGPRLDPELLLVYSLSRGDWMARPRLTWRWQKDWRLAVGADIFGGPQLGLFGRFKNSDRIYLEARYSF